MPPRKTIGNALVILAVGVLGGVAALVGAAALGRLDTETRTVISTTAEPAAARLSDGLTVHEIYRRSAPGVVRVFSTSSAQPGQAQGSGFVIDKDGHIVTNYHVVQDGSEVQVAFGESESYDAEIVGVDPSTDLAVLKVDVDSDALTPLALANSDAVQVGDVAVAIGSPFNLARTATAGIVSALNRSLRAPNDFTISDLIQTDAPINHGNSGGPLLNDDAQVIGVNAQIETGGTGSGNVGIGFAIPSNTVKTVVAQIIEHGKVEHAWLGITGQELDEQIVSRLDLPVESGILIQEVLDGTGAEKAGLEGGDSTLTVAGQTYRVGGDIIVAIDGKKLENIDALRDVVAEHKPGDKVELEIYHDGDKKTVTVTLGEQPSARPAVR